MAEDHAPNGKSSEPSTGEKHQTDHQEPDAKRTKTGQQQTIEESFGKEEGKDKSENLENDVKQEEKSDDKTEKPDDKKEESSEANGKATKNDDDTAEIPHEEKNVPSNILEKGIIYFFIRGRVNIENPENVTDIQRSFMILRPIAADSKLGEGTIGDVGTTRLIALPKKTFPQSGKEKYMMFVEKAHTSFDELKKTFLSGEDYETKTAGTRHTPAATPVAEGVYAFTTTGKDSHLAYKMTLPEQAKEVQRELGINEEGSWILSTKNPQYEGPANAQLDESPEFPQKILDEFRALRWTPSKPEHLDYAKAQFLLIGESSGLDKAVEPQEDDKKKPEEVLDELEDEDVKRMKHLEGDDSASIFQDLQARAKDYPKLQTTF